MDFWVPLITENELGPAGRAVHASRDDFKDGERRLLVGSYEEASTLLPESRRHTPPAERYNPADPRHAGPTVAIDRYLRYHRQISLNMKDPNFEVEGGDGLLVPKGHG